jgi:hypothetical protein
MPHLDVCVTRATAELPSFHGVSRKKLRAWPATQVQSGGGIIDTGNQQTVDGDNQRAQWPTYMLYALYGLALEGAWIQSGLDRKALSLRKIMAPIGFRASRPPAHRTSHL